MSQLRVAVIGAGHLGRIHAKLISTIDDVELVAVADPSVMARNAVAGVVDKCVKLVADYRDLIDAIDAAVIATPTRMHFDIARTLLPAGIHTLIEKPLTDSEADAQAIVDMAAKYNCVVSVGHCEQFNASIRAALVEVGTPKFVQAARLSSYTFRSTDIGVVHDLMIHDIDLVNSIFPGSLVDTKATGISVFGNNEDIAQARLQFSCGGVANLTASRCSFVSERSIQVFGSDGFARVDLAKQEVDFVRIPSWIRQREFDFDSVSPEQRDFIKDNLFSSVLPRQQTEVEPVNAILCEQQNWIDSIRYGALPRVSAEQGRQAVSIAQSVIDTIATHQWSAGGQQANGPLVTMPTEFVDAMPAQMMAPQPPMRKRAA